MQPTLVFIHGMFLTPKSWEPWLGFFRQRGYRCLAPAWPLHEGEPARLRAHVPEGTGELSLERVIEHLAREVAAEPEPPVLIGHSLGGLVVQALINRGLGAAGVCISSLPPNRLLSLHWGFLRNSLAIANPLKGDRPCPMTFETFHQYFCNTLDEDEARRAYDSLAVHESRNVLRDTLGPAAQLDLRRPHAPLLFISGTEDHIIPERLSVKNAEAYTDCGSIADFQEFASRDHLICSEPGWRQVAAFVEGWIAARAPGRAPLGFVLR